MPDLALWDPRHDLDADALDVDEPRPLRRPDPGKRTLTQFLAGRGPRFAPPAGEPSSVAHTAQAGVAGGGGALPFLDQLAAAFGGVHDLSTIGAHVGGAAAEACDALGAEAYATGAQVAFRAAPDLHTAAHEAAHVLQQRAGLQLDGGVGQAGDVHERHADAVADRVVAGASAADLLAPLAGGGAPPTAAGSGVQRRARPPQRICLLDVTLTASSGGEVFAALEAGLRDADVPEASLRTLRAAAGRGALAVTLLFADLLPAGVSLGEYGGLLTTIATNYVAWVGSLHDQGAGQGDGAPGTDPRGGDDSPNRRPAALLRATLSRLGYSEKQIYPDTPGEIDSGGDILMELVVAASAVLEQIHAEHPELHVVVTGGNDKFHQPPTFAPNSHSRGKALDFKVTPAGVAELDAVATILRARSRTFKGTSPDAVASTRGGTDTTVLAFAQDEYRCPSPGSSGGHFHINV